MNRCQPVFCAWDRILRIPRGPGVFFAKKTYFRWSASLSIILHQEFFTKSNGRLDRCSFSKGFRRSSSTPCHPSNLKPSGKSHKGPNWRSNDRQHVTRSWRFGTFFGTEVVATDHVAYLRGSGLLGHFRSLAPRLWGFGLSLAWLSDSFLGEELGQFYLSCCQHLTTWSRLTWGHCTSSVLSSAVDGGRFRFTCWPQTVPRRLRDHRRFRML